MCKFILSIWYGWCHNRVKLPPIWLLWVWISTKWKKLCIIILSLDDVFLPSFQIITTFSVVDSMKRCFDVQQGGSSRFCIFGWSYISSLKKLMIFSTCQWFFEFKIKLNFTSFMFFFCWHEPCTFGMSKIDMFNFSDKNRITHLKLI